MKNTISKNGQIEPPNLKLADHLLAALIFLLVLTSYYWLPSLLSVVVEDTQIATFITSAFSAILATYVFLLTYRIKKNENRNRFIAARNLIATDIKEISALCNHCKSEWEKNMYAERYQWNEMICDLVTWESHYKDKKKYLIFYASQFPMESFFLINDLYTEFFRTLIRVERFKINEGDVLQDDRKKEFIEHLTQCLNNINKIEKKLPF